MSNASTTAATGSFSPVGFDKPIRTDAEIDLQNLSTQEREVVEAEEFVIYGKANIEQWNEPGPGESNLYIEMDALEEKIDQLLAIENISFAHQDIRVGEPLASHTLESDATVHLDAGETLEFAAGDELRTQVIREGEPLPGDNGTAEEDALWLAANVFGRTDERGSRFSQKVRLAAYQGELDGFSVTVDKREMTATEQGTKVHEVDFLAVTIGPDDKIKNPGSSFGVAEFQGLFAFDDAVSPERGPAEMAVQRSLRRRTMSSIYKSLFGSAKDGLAAEALQQAHDDDIPVEEAIEAVAGDDADTVMEQAQEHISEIEALAEDDDMEDADELEDEAASLADSLGVDKEVVMAAIDEIEDMKEEVEDPEGDGPEEDPDGSGNGAESQLTEADVTAIVEDQLEDAGYVTEDTLEEHLESELSDVRESVETVNETVEEQLDTLGENLGDNLEELVAQQMETGGTPAPTGGGEDATNLLEEAEEWADIGASGD